MDRVLKEREALYTDLFPWRSPDYGLDEHWLRTYPYEQTVLAGRTFDIELHATNHSADKMEIIAKPMLPCGWSLCDTEPVCTVIPPSTCGLADKRFINGDATLTYKLFPPDDALPGRHIVPFSVIINGEYHGWLKHAIINVREVF